MNTKKKIAILGSTGSIGKTVLKIISRDTKNFKILLLTANKNYKELLKQTTKFNVQNVIITDKVSYNKFKKYNKNQNLNIYKNFHNLNKIFKNKIDYTMSSIVGIDGLDPTIKIIKYTKNIAIANKESIICGWNLIQREAKRFNTCLIPVDSEHFSIWYALKNNDTQNINKVFLTASGGPLLNLSSKKIKKIKIKEVLNHPNWKMGSKISIDSSTMMNKVFEVIETQKIFNLPKNKISILLHEDSYLHAIVKFQNGITKLLIHDTNMEIPIFNTLYNDVNKSLRTKNLDFTKLNNLSLKFLNQSRFPIIKIIKKISNRDSLFETVIVACNDELVNLFLNKKINYIQLQKNLVKLLCSNKFSKYKLKKAKNVKEIEDLNRYVRLKVRNLCI